MRMVMADGAATHARLPMTLDQIELFEKRRPKNLLRRLHRPLHPHHLHRPLTMIFRLNRSLPNREKWHSTRCLYHMNGASILSRHLPVLPLLLKTVLFTLLIHLTTIIMISIRCSKISILIRERVNRALRSDQEPLYAASCSMNKTNANPPDIQR